MTATDVDVSVVVVSYNTVEPLRRCLASVTAHDTTASVEVIVVDNDSRDGSPDMVEREFPAVVLVRSGENLGFGRGVNLGASMATGRHLLLVNSDAVLHRGAVDALLDVARRRPRAGVVGGRVVDTSGRLDPKSCWGLPSLWSLFCFATGLSTVFAGSERFDPESLGPWPRDSEREVGAVSGALALVPMACWRQLGGFDPDYFMYSEDIDLAERVRAAGLQSWVTPAAVVTHELGASSTSADKRVMVLTGKVTYLRKRWSGARAVVGIALLVAGVTLRATGERVVRRDRDGGWMHSWRRRNEWMQGYPRTTTPSDTT